MPRLSKCLFAIVLLAGAATASAALPRSVPSLAPMLEKTLPGVVNISTTSGVRMRENPLFRDPFFRRFFDMPERERQRQSLGSGVVIDAEEGLVVTNAHVIEKAEEITVSLQDGRTFTAELVGADPESDVAMVRIDAGGLTEIPLGDSDALRVGDFVVAVGNPFGLNQTVISGIVSALGRSGLGIKGYEDFIQTDASINPGNSGGALINLKGELVGINTAILAPAGGNVGIGFSIPINMVKHLTTQLAEHGRVRRGRLGVYIQDLTPDLAEALDIDRSRGAVIAQVMPGSAAEEAGLEQGDLVTAIDGAPVAGAADLRNAVGLLRPGKAIALTVLRAGEAITIEAVVKSRRAQSVPGRPWPGRPSSSCRKSSAARVWTRASTSNPSIRAAPRGNTSCAAATSSPRSTAVGRAPWTSSGGWSRRRSSCCSGCSGAGGRSSWRYADPGRGPVRLRALTARRRRSSRACGIIDASQQPTIKG